MQAPSHVELHVGKGISLDIIVVFLISPDGVNHGAGLGDHIRIRENAVVSDNFIGRKLNGSAAADFLGNGDQCFDVDEFLRGGDLLRFDSIVENIEVDERVAVGGLADDVILSIGPVAAWVRTRVAGFQGQHQKIEICGVDVGLSHLEIGGAVRAEHTSEEIVVELLLSVLAQSSPLVNGAWLHIDCPGYSGVLEDQDLKLEHVLEGLIRKIVKGDRKSRKRSLSFVTFYKL